MTGYDRRFTGLAEDSLGRSEPSVAEIVSECNVVALLSYTTPYKP